MGGLKNHLKSQRCSNVFRKFLDYKQSSRSAIKLLKSSTYKKYSFSTSARSPCVFSSKAYTTLHCSISAVRIKRPDSLGSTENVTVWEKNQQQSSGAGQCGTEIIYNYRTLGNELLLGGNNLTFNSETRGGTDNEISPGLRCGPHHLKSPSAPDCRLTGKNMTLLKHTGKVLKMPTNSNGGHNHYFVDEISYY